MLYRKDSWNSVGVRAKSFTMKGVKDETWSMGNLTYEILAHLKTGVLNKRHLAAAPVDGRSHFA